MLQISWSISMNSLQFKMGVTAFKKGVGTIIYVIVPTHNSHSCIIRQNLTQTVKIIHE